MTTTDPILTYLERLRADHEDAGRLAEARRVDQLLIAAQTLARLAEERATAEQAGDRDGVVAVDAQAQYWTRQVNLAELLEAAESAVLGRAPADADAGGQPASGPAAPSKTKAR